MNNDKIQVVDENGKEMEFDILFTFESDETHKKYVLYYDGEAEQPEVYSSIFDEEGNLFPIESPAEWEMIEEVFHSFIAQNDEGEGCGCNHEHGEDCGCDHEHGEDCGCDHEHDEEGKESKGCCCQN